ncbi:MAG: cation:proton antiporter [Candidatus Nezhaarchaeales archaeon]
MEVIDSYLLLTLLFTLATLLAWISKRLGLSYVTGYIIAGVALSYMTPTIGGEFIPLLSIFSDMAIALLAFEVGREVGLENIKRISAVPIVIGLGEVLASFTVATIVGLVFRFSWSDVVVLALISSFCSTAITYKLMEERGLGGDMRRLIFTVAAVEDIIVVLALTLLPQIGRGYVDLFRAIESITFSIIVAVTLIIVGVTIVRRVFAKIVKPDEFGLAVSISLSFAYALISRRAGLSPALGAFAAGLALSAHPQADQISERMKPVREVFLIIFFITMGFNANVSAIPASQLTLAFVLGLLVVLTRLMAFSSSTWITSGYSLEEAIKMGFFTTTIGEFSLIVAYEATKLGMVLQPMLMISAMSTIFAAMISSILTKKPDYYAGKLSSLMPMPVKLFIDHVSKYLNRALEGKVSRAIRELFMRILKEGALMVLTAFIASSTLYVVDGALEYPYDFVVSAIIIAIAIAVILRIAQRLYIHADALCFKFVCKSEILNPNVRKLLTSLIFISLMSLTVLVALLTSSQYIASLINRIVGSDLGYAITTAIIVGILVMIILTALSKLKRLLFGS